MTACLAGDELVHGRHELLATGVLGGIQVIEQKQHKVRRWARWRGTVAACCGGNAVSAGTERKQQRCGLGQAGHCCFAVSPVDGRRGPSSLCGRQHLHLMYQTAQLRRMCTAASPASCWPACMPHAAGCGGLMCVCAAHKRGTIPVVTGLEAPPLLRSVILALFQPTSARRSQARETSAVQPCSPPGPPSSNICASHSQAAHCRASHTRPSAAWYRPARAARKPSSLWHGD